MKKSVIVGIAGGTGSGKSTVATKIADAFGDEAIVMDMDSYYKDLKYLTIEQRREVNFDHPNAFDVPLFVDHLLALQRGETVEKPEYDFTQSLRKKETKTVYPAPVIIIEGLMILGISELREILDTKVFVDTDDDIRIIRRIQRDVDRRGRSLKSVISQYISTVRPMHLSFVEPSKRYADVVVPRGGNNEVAIAMLVSAIRDKIQQLS